MPLLVQVHPKSINIQTQISSIKWYMKRLKKRLTYDWWWLIVVVWLLWEWLWLMQWRAGGGLCLWAIGGLWWLPVMCVQSCVIVGRGVVCGCLVVGYDLLFVATYGGYWLCFVRWFGCCWWWLLRFVVQPCGGCFVVLMKVNNSDCFVVTRRIVTDDSGELVVACGCGCRWFMWLLVMCVQWWASIHQLYYGYFRQVHLSFL